MNVSKITIARLFSLGNYEHIRYELTIDVAPGESPATALIGAERLMEALNPKTSTKDRRELERQSHRLAEQRKLLDEKGAEAFRQQHGWFEGTPAEYLARCEKSHDDDITRRVEWENRSAKARKLLEDLGGAANWRDAKLSWED
jgi:hypothetical protein